MATRLKIDLTQGILEVEGSESFVKAIYSDFKVHFIGEEAGESLGASKQRRRRKKGGPVQPNEISARPSTAVSEKIEPPPAKIDEVTVEPEPAKVKPGYQFINDLDLAAAQDRVSLVEFMDTKFPITNEERNLVFLYYLQHLLKQKPITQNHIFTCYKAAKIRVPLNLESSLKTTAGRRRWIKITKTGRLSTTPSGKLYVEKQLPKKLKS